MNPTSEDPIDPMAGMKEIVKESLEISHDAKIRTKNGQFYDAAHTRIVGDYLAFRDRHGKRVMIHFSEIATFIGPEDRE